MHKPSDYNKQPHIQASRLVNLMKDEQASGKKYSDPVTKALDKLDYFLLAALVRHKERFIDDEEEED